MATRSVARPRAPHQGHGQWSPRPGPWVAEDDPVHGKSNLLRGYGGSAEARHEERDQGKGGHFKKGRKANGRAQAEELPQRDPGRAPGSGKEVCSPHRWEAAQEPEHGRGLKPHGDGHGHAAARTAQGRGAPVAKDKYPVE